MSVFPKSGTPPKRQTPGKGELAGTVVFPGGMLGKPKMDRMSIPAALTGLRHEFYGQRRFKPHVVVAATPFIPKEQLKPIPKYYPSLSKSAPQLPSPELPEPERRPFAFRKFMELPDDVTKLPNERVERVADLEDIIKMNERNLAKNRELKATKSPGNAMVEEKPTHWDRLPRNAMLSEQMAEYFPKSQKLLSTMGGGKDPRFLRPKDHQWDYREALLKCKDMIS